MVWMYWHRRWKARPLRTFFWTLGPEEVLLLLLLQLLLPLGVLHRRLRNRRINQRRKKRLVLFLSTFLVVEANFSLRSPTKIWVSVYLTRRHSLFSAPPLYSFIQYLLHFLRIFVSLFLVLLGSTEQRIERSRQIFFSTLTGSLQGNFL